MAGGQPKSLKDWLIWGAMCTFGLFMVGILKVGQLFDIFRKDDKE